MSEKQCPSCGGNCGRTIKSGCMYDSPVERKALRVTSISQQEEIEKLRQQREYWEGEALRYCQNSDHWREQLAECQADLAAQKAEWSKAYDIGVLAKHQLAECQRDAEEYRRAMQRVINAYDTLPSGHPATLAHLHINELRKATAAYRNRNTAIQGDKP